MKHTDKKRLDQAKEDTLSRFLHNDLSHEAVREIFRLCVVQEINKGEPPKRGKGDGKHQKREADHNGLAPSAESKIDPQELLKNQVQLPSLPKVFSRIVDLMSSPVSSADDFAGVIMRDPALSARLLKIVNSAFYGFRSEIATVSQAVTVIGTRDLYALCLGTSVISAFKNIPIGLVDMPSFWKHSIACGVIARLIAEASGQADKERFFVAGLLHDIGRLVILHHLPLQAKSILSFAENNKLLLTHSEMQILGFDHAKIGGLLLKKWKLPAELDSMIRFHHEPTDSAYSGETAVVHTANVLANAFQHGSSGEAFVPPLVPAAWRETGIGIKQLAKIAADADAQIPEMVAILFPEAAR